jgi:hypothetical protein
MESESTADIKYETLAMTSIGTVIIEYKVTGPEIWTHVIRQKEKPFNKPDSLAAIIQRKEYTYHGLNIVFNYKNGTYVWK